MGFATIDALGDGECDVRSDDFNLYKAQIDYNDYQKDIWFYGDSYSGTQNPARWPYQAAHMGARFMVNGLTGSGTVTMIAQLLNDICIRFPKIIIWGLGMNDQLGTTINEYYDILKDIGTMANMEIILCTIPSVLTLDHSEKNAYIKGLPGRYIDFDEAVSNGVDNSWKTGLREENGVHPTNLGAVILAQEALKTVPELTP